MDKEAKEILLAIQSKVENLQGSVENLQSTVSKLQDTVEKMQGDIVDLKQGQENLREEMLSKLEETEARLCKKIEEGDERNYQEIRAVNQRLAVYQEETSKRVDTLFDADTTRLELLEIHDEEIPEIKSELYNHSIRIKILESKTVGA